MEILRNIMMVTTAAALVCGIFSGCADKNSPEHSVTEPLPTDSLNTVTAEFDTGTLKATENAEEIGSFVITLYPEYAPETCENFADLVKDGFYDGLIFHRVMDGSISIAQTGDPTGTGTGGAEKKIKGEFAANGFEQNTLSHTRGIVSMARRNNDMDSASSQFFICYSDKDTVLDGNYAAFGEVTEGMEVVDKFLTVELVDNGYGEVSVPTVAIAIKKAEMIEDDDKGHPQARFTMTIG